MNDAVFIVGNNLDAQIGRLGLCDGGQDGRLSVPNSCILDFIFSFGFYASNLLSCA
jgi:hypothetical protein